MDGLHRDRGRAVSFGVSAEDYDRFRPGPPPVVVADLLAVGSRTVLDVGCGTGKVAAALAAAGREVLGVEPDERMATVARRHGIPVEAGAFEDWPDAGRRFDLVTCADAWHWIDPQRGVAKAARVVSSGGAVACFWNSYAVDDRTAEAFDEVYVRHAPEVARPWRPGRSRSVPAELVSRAAELFEGSAEFVQVETRSYRWERTLDGQAWVGVAGTVSDHLALGADRLAGLLAELRTTIAGLGDTVRSHHRTELMLARRD